jgi:hypothetical protein
VTRADRAGLAFDVLATVALALFAGRIWGDCALGSEVAGDSFVALDCGKRWFDQGFTRPAQPIFGWGLCASYAPLYWGAESLWEVAWRRSQVAAAMVPLTYLTVVSVVPGWLGRSPVAARVGASCAALAILIHETLGRTTSTGSHGYLAFTWTAVAFLGWAWATRPPSSEPVRFDRGLRTAAAVMGMTAAPMAMMNHPYTGWLVLSAVALVPLVLRRVGVPGTLLAIAAGVALAVPRVLELRLQMGDGVSAGELAHQPGEWSLGAGEILEWIFDPRHLTMLAGLACFLVAAGLVAARSRDREVRWTVAGWSAAMAGAAAGLWGLAEFVGYLQDYHVLMAFPLGAIGLGVGAAAVVKFLGRPEAIARGGRGFAVARVVALSGALLVGVAALGSTADEGDNPIHDPWCVDGPHNGGTAEGSLRLARAIRDDLVHVPRGVSALITNLNLKEGRLDSAVPTAFGLVIEGVPPERLVCCSEGAPPPVWYFIIDIGDQDLDYSAWGLIEGVDVLMTRPEVDELTLVVRTPEALATIGEQLCAAIPPDRVVAVHYYDEIVDLLASSRRELLKDPPSPVPSCINRMQ